MIPGLRLLRLPKLLSRESTEAIASAITPGAQHPGHEAFKAALAEVDELRALERAALAPYVTAARRGLLP